MVHPYTSGPDDTIPLAGKEHDLQNGVSRLLLSMYEPAGHVQDLESLDLMKPRIQFQLQ